MWTETTTKNSNENANAKYVVIAVDMREHKNNCCGTIYPDDDEILEVIEHCVCSGQFGLCFSVDFCFTATGILDRLFECVFLVSKQLVWVFETIDKLGKREGERERKSEKSSKKLLCLN